MIVYPAIDPVAFHIFSWPVYWYGLMYLVGLFAGWGLLAWRLRTYPYLQGFLNQEQLADLIFYCALGMVIGGRLGYMLFYDWQSWWAEPVLILKTWKGGMSFHGGLLGVLTALLLFGRKVNRPFLALSDFVAPVVPIGLGAGRIGNFINGELWGRVTNSSWGMVFPRVDSSLRHPSQLYEFVLEGVFLFLILWIYSRSSRPKGAVSGLFACIYGIFRWLVEFFREPDVQIGYLFFGQTEGQLLSLPLIMVGLILMVRAYRR